MNIIFDIGMVLADFRWAEYCKELGISEDVVRLFEERMILDPIWNEFDLAVIPHETLIDMIEKRFPENKAEYRLFWKDIRRLVLSFDYSAKWVSSLKEHGHKVYLLSNYPKFMFETHTENFDFLPLVDGKVVSYEYHIMKPDENIYKILLAKYDLKAEECIFIDDRAVNIEGAKKLGIRGIVFKNYEQASAELESMLS